MSAVSGSKLVNPDVLIDPYDYYRLLRSQPPVESPVGYLISRHEDVVAVVQNTKVFSSRIRGDKATQWGDDPTPAMVEAIKKGLPQRDTMVASDPPEHTRFKKLGTRAFLPARVRQVEASLHSIVDELIDAFAQRGEVEFVSGFAVPYPLTVIAEILGCDRADVPQLKKWSDDALLPLSGRLNDDERLACAEGRVESQHYMMGKIKERQARRTDDLLSDLIYAEVDGDRLDELEVLSMALGILVAGNETSRNTLANGMSILAERPNLADRLRNDPSMTQQFVEELLRYDAPVQMLYRLTTEDAEVGGTKIPKGSRVALIWASANRDEERWSQPDEFDLDRERASAHLSFGHGEHHCIGHVLARAELRVGFTALLNRMSDIRPGGEAQRIITVTFRGFSELPLRFSPR